MHLDVFNQTNTSRLAQHCWEGDLKMCPHALGTLRLCRERAQPMKAEAPCYTAAAGCWVIYNACESDQMQIVQADD